jgi:hypothetical protein
LLKGAFNILLTKSVDKGGVEGLKGPSSSKLSDGAVAYEVDV